MFARHEEAERRFSQLTRSTSEGLVFHPRGPSRTGYLVDADAARRIKTYFAYDFWVFIAIMQCALWVLPEWLHPHPFLMAIPVGILCFAADRLIKLCLLRSCAGASTPGKAEDFASPPPEQYTRLEISCGLVNLGIVFVLLVFLAVISRSIDAWLFAAVCGAALVYGLLPAQRARQVH